MSPLEIATIRRKLARMLEDLDRLARVADLDLAAWRADEQRLGHPAPESAYQGFVDIAGKAGVLDSALAAELAPSSGLRNRLVHRYDQIDDPLVLAGLRSAVEIFPRYVEALAAYVDGIA